MAGIVLMLALWLAVVVLSSSSALHHEVCSDARETSHTCALTTLAKGQCLAPPPLLPVLLTEFVSQDAISPSESNLPSCADVRLASGRAPPAVLVLG